MQIPTPAAIVGYVGDLVGYLGARMFVGAAATTALATLVYLLGTGDLTLDRYIGVAAVASLAVIAVAAIVGRTVTDRDGKAPNGEQPPPDGGSVGE